MHAISIDNSKKSAINGKKWSNPGASFYDEICLDNDVLHEAYLTVGDVHNDPRSKTPYSRSGCKYPHHSLVDNKLVLNVAGVKAAYSRVKQMGLFKGKVKDHLVRHYKELGIYDGSTMDTDERITENFAFIESAVGINPDASAPIKDMPLQDIIEWMDCIKYDDDDMNWKLRSPMEVEKNKIGNCHDQSLFLYSILDYREDDCGQLFFIEYNEGDDTGGMTHTLTWIHEGGKYKWIEHAWDKFKGINGPYDTMDDMKAAVRKAWQSTSNGSFSNIMFATVHNYKVGMNLADYVSSWELSDLDELTKEMEWVESVVYSSFMEADEPPEIDESEEGTEEQPSEDESPEEVPEEPTEDDAAKEEEPSEEPEQPEEDPKESEENPMDEEIPEEPAEEPEKPSSLPKQTDNQEKDKNGVNRKKLYIAFIEWCKAYNSKNTFGSVFDKDIFHNVYPFVPHEMRYFYRLANPILCVLAGDLTFFQVSELKAINKDNKKLNEMMIFAATKTDLRVFSNKDKRVYRAVEENGEIVMKGVLGDSFDLYLQNMIKQGDILSGNVNGKEEPGDVQ